MLLTNKLSLQRKETDITILRIAISVTAWVFLYPLSSGQATGDPKEDFRFGEFYISSGMYQEALPFYLSALKYNPGNCNINYRIGLCYSKIIGEQEHALSFLEKAVTNVNSRYVGGRYKEIAAPIEAWLLLGDAYHRINELPKASFAYHQYKNYVENSDKKMYELVLQKIMNVGISFEIQRSATPVDIINMGNVINSRFSDFNPVLAEDQKLLIYTQYWESSDNIMITRYSEEGWSVPRSLNDEIGSQKNCYTSAISSQGNELYLIAHDGPDHDIFVSYLVNGKWSGMAPVQGKVNSRYRESSVCLSSDGNTLYFSSDRPGGSGGFDIYKAGRDGKKWTNITNLGSPVNTIKNEEGPFITSDGKMLFFSSDGHESVGNMDIVYSFIDNNGKYSTPINPGLPFNTSGDDLYFLYFPETRTGYLSRDFTDGFGKNDIYRIQTGDNLSYISNPDDQLKGEFFNSPSALENLPVLTTSPQIISPAQGYNLSSAPGSDGADPDRNNDKEQISVDSEILLGTESVIILKNHLDYSEGNDRNGKTIFFTDEEMESENRDNSIPVYTIQILALRNPTDPRKLSLKPVKVSLGNDGLSRYTFSEYVGYSKALEALEKIRNSGYPDAFIRNINTVQNYTGND